jgi:hypothetical protein
VKLARYSSDHFPVVAGFVAFVLYWSTRAGAPTEWDGVQLTLGLDRFDVRQDSPHAPGYWNYVVLGRLFRALTPLSGTQALVLASALAAAVTVGLVGLLGRDLGGRWLGIAAAAIVGTTPFFWFYGSSVATYVFDALAGVVLMLLAWRARPHGWQGIAAAATLGISAGFRQTSILILFPLALVAALRANGRDLRAWILSAATGLAAIALWAVPMLLEQPGGLEEVLHNNEFNWDQAAGRTAVWLDGTEPGRNFKQFTAHLIAAVGLVALLGLAALVVGIWRRNRGTPGRATRFTPVELLAIGAVPPVLFMTLVHFGKSGYLLALLPAAVLLALWPVARLRGQWRAAGTFLVVLVALFGTQRFLYGAGALPDTLVDRGPWFTARVNGAPFGGTRDVIEVADRYQDVFEEMRTRFDPERDVIVYTNGNGGHWFRHAMFALPEFTIHLNDGSDGLTGRGYQYQRERDVVIEVPPGGDALFAVDLPTSEIADLQEQGRISGEFLEAGAGLWRVPPGESLFGLRVEEVESALDDEIVVRSPELN